MDVGERESPTVDMIVGSVSQGGAVPGRGQRPAEKLIDPCVFPVLLAAASAAAAGDFGASGSGRDWEVGYGWLGMLGSF